MKCYNNCLLAEFEIITKFGTQTSIFTAGSSECLNMVDSSKESQKTGLHDGNICMSELEHLKDGWHHSCFEQSIQTSWLGGRIFPLNLIHVRVYLRVLQCARLFYNFFRICRTLPVCLKPMFYFALQSQNELGRLIGAQQRVRAETALHSATQV